MNYQESISRLEEASVFGIKPGLERMQKILAVLGNPEKACKISRGRMEKGASPL